MHLVASSVGAVNGRQGKGGGKEGIADHWEQTAVDTTDTLFTDDRYGAVDEPAIPRIWTLCVVDEFCSIPVFSLRSALVAVILT